MTYYERKKEAARQEAIEYSMSDKQYSYSELYEKQEHFRKLGKRYGLIEEFKENGII
jgi:hypothetical protein